jgi:large subunit ribosomal protein L30e
MAIDAGKELRRAVDTGKVLFGRRQVEKSLLKGECKLVIVSRNAEKYAGERVKQLCETARTPLFLFNATGFDIGNYCGKPFVVSFACIENPGKSKVLLLAKKK